jgi:VCBS repeat-containing protein
VQALVNEPGKWTTGAYDSVGVWQASPIIVSGLNNQNSWSLTTQVEDLAGNVAIDDTPTLIQPLPILLSEGQLIIGTGTDIKITSLRIDIGGDASINDQPFTFSEAARQLDLSAIRSSGSDTSVNVTTDGKSLRVIRDSDNAVVLEARINESAATVTITLFQSVEQSGDNRTLLTGILLQAAQNDVTADPQADVVESKLSLVIRDNISNFLVDDSYQVIEAVTATSNLYDNDNQGEAPLTLVSITYQGTDYPIDPTTSNSISTSEGTLLVNAQGEWSFTADRNQDNSSANPTLAFSYTVSDADGDLDTADVVIEVLDGAEGVIQPVAATDTEVDYANLADPILTRPLTFPLSPALIT